MTRWLVILFLLTGLAGTAYVSHRGADARGPVTSAEDGSGIPTPRVP